VNFAVEPDGIGSTKTSFLQKLKTIAGFERVINEHGVLLVEDMDACKSGLLKKIVSLPVEERKAWLELIKQLYGNGQIRLSNGVSCVCKAESVEELEACPADVFCLEENRAGCLGKPEDQFSFAVRLGDRNFDITMLEWVEESQTVQELRELSSKPLDKGTEIKEIWRKRFSRLAGISNIVQVVDSYALKRHFKKPKAAEASGLFRFLQYLACECDAEVIELYSCGQDVITREELKDRLDKSLYSLDFSKLKSIEVFDSTDIKKTKEIEHDRWIRFGHHVVELGWGLQIFEKDVLGRKCSFSYRTLDPADSRSIRELRRVSNQITLK